MSVDEKTVRRIAHLARIAVADEALPALAAELNGILQFMEQLNEVDVEGVEPMTGVEKMRLKRREDAVAQGFEPGPGLACLLAPIQNHTPFVPSLSKHKRRQVAPIALSAGWTSQPLRTGFDRLSAYGLVWSLANPEVARQERRMVPLSFAGEELVLTAGRAVYWPRERALLVADLHLEKASFFAQHGQPLPPYDSRETLERIGGLQVLADIDALPPEHPDRARILATHAAALAAGEAGYLDPASGLFVLSAGFLARRGTCCGRGCRHCPYVDDPPSG